MAWSLALLSTAEADPSDDSEPNLALVTSPSILASPIHLLRYFEYPCVPPPPCARVGDPKLKQRASQPVRLWHLWKFGAFAAVKATSLVSDIVSHHFWGPRRKSWGIEMTLLSSIMRDVSRHSHLADIDTIRLLMSIGGLVPLPSDALVTSVTFRVRKRHLRGILADFDAAEDGSRELSGEWVVGKKTWQRLQTEWRATNRAGSEEKTSSREKFALPTMHLPKNKERVVLYFHGGAYYMFSAATHRLITIPLSKYLDTRVFSVDYRLAPETRFPGPLHDAVSSYFRLVDDLHIPPENIIVVGDSAGGGLALALLMYLRDNNYSLPSGAILMSPWVDLTMSCESWDSNAQYDIVPMPEPGDHLNPIACYLGEHMEKYLTHPYASPLFGDLKGLPPMLIQAGEVEVLRDEITLLAHKATLAGVEVRHELYEDSVHVFQSLPFLDTARRAFLSCRDFVRKSLPQWQSRSPQALEGSALMGLAQEIDNDAARVVRGDGTETGSGREDIAEAMQTDNGRGRSSSRIPQILTQSLSQEEDPSWGTQWPSPPGTQEDDHETNDFEGIAFRTKEHTALAHVHADEASVPDPSMLTRLRSTFSLIADAVSVSATNHLSPHAPSSANPASADAPPLPSHTAFRRHRISSLSVTASTAAPPTPAIRRSEHSHPDISSLCMQWERSGPANQTMTFKPEAAPLAKRNRSRTVSLCSSKDV